MMGISLIPIHVAIFVVLFIVEIDLSNDENSVTMVMESILIVVVMLVDFLIVEMDFFNELNNVMMGTSLIPMGVLLDVC
jgi:uncharacterized membrane protein